MNPKILKYSEQTIFYGGVAFNIWVVCHFTFFGGIDGPSHLYYSKIVQYLLSGNAFLSRYFVLNRLPVPNLTDHYLLALFDIVFRSSISGKLLLIIFVAGFPLIFRLMVIRYNPGGIAASSFIIPFTHCTLLYSGAYNFCLSFTFLFIALYYYFSNLSYSSGSYRPFNYILFFLLILLNYFTNALSFLFLFSICGLAELYWVFSPSGIKGTANKPKLFRRVLLFCALWIPGFVMLQLFSNAVPGLHHASQGLSFSELLQWVYDFKCLTFYNGAEDFYTHLIFYWLLASLLVAVYSRLKKDIGLKFRLTDIFLALFAGTAILYFIIPEGAGVGMISDRLLYYFIIFLLCWIALQKGMGKITLLLSGVIMAIHVIFFFNVHYSLLTALDNDARAMQQASAYIKPNSVIFIIRYEQNPMETSLTNIIGIDKPEVILERYEPDAGWFAVNRTLGPEPDWGVKYSADGKVGWIDKKNRNALIAPVDYIIITGDYSLHPDATSEGLRKINQAYTEAFSSADKKVHVFGLRDSK